MASTKTRYLCFSLLPIFPHLSFKNDPKLTLSLSTLFVPVIVPTSFLSVIDSEGHDHTIVFNPIIQFHSELIETEGSGRRRCIEEWVSILILWSKLGRPRRGLYYFRSSCVPPNAGGWDQCSRRQWCISPNSTIPQCSVNRFVMLSVAFWFTYLKACCLWFLWFVMSLRNSMLLLSIKSIVLLFNEGTCWFNSMPKW